MKVHLLLIMLLCASIAIGQNITFPNPSLEDEPQPSKVPRGWYNCGIIGESPPDINPNPQFNVTKSAFHGFTYVGMVIRDNDTWEAIGAKISQPLQQNYYYKFSMRVARSENLISLSRATGDEVNYIYPAILRIWAGDSYCDRAELLAETDIIENTKWENIEFIFRPEENWEFIVIEAYFDEAAEHAYNGNIMIDYLSDIQLLTAEETQTEMKLTNSDPAEEMEKVEKEKNSEEVDKLIAVAEADMIAPKEIKEIENFTLQSNLLRCELSKDMSTSKQFQIAACLSTANVSILLNEWMLLFDKKTSNEFTSTIAFLNENNHKKSANILQQLIDNRSMIEMKKMLTAKEKAFSRIGFQLLRNAWVEEKVTLTVNKYLEENHTLYASDLEKCK